MVIDAMRKMKPGKEEKMMVLIRMEWQFPRIISGPVLFLFIGFNFMIIIESFT